jgi:hypothetical protein
VQEAETGQVGAEIAEEASGGVTAGSAMPRRRKRTSLATFCERLSGEPLCQTCDSRFGSMIEYARHMKREHANMHRQEGQNDFRIRCSV